MPKTRENISSPTVSYRDFDVAGNQFRIYYDADGAMIFVLDNTVDAGKKNVLLVIDGDGNRKWDDILTQDYGIDLETVRPKKDNKYQKLDIEYGSLTPFAQLVAADATGGDIVAAGVALTAFRGRVMRRVADERLAAAELSAEHARETIAKTRDTMEELKARLRQLLEKLRRQRREVGREPTKQSASKILRTEAQIDSVREKTKRAEKRLDNAMRRLAAAEDDADAARQILEHNAAPVAVAQPHDVMRVVDAPVPAAPVFADVKFTENDTGETEMAEDEVKPLFDKDPEILDEEIAFKPIDFDVPQTVAPAPVAEPVATTPAFDTSAESVGAPNVFVPPVPDVPSGDVMRESVREEIQYDTPAAPRSSVLDSMTPVETPSAPATSDWDAEFAAYAAAADAPREPIAVTPVSPVVEPVPEPAPMPEISPAPASSSMRPVSPVKHAASSDAPARPASGAAAPVAADGARRPTLVYYVLLVLLIAMSILTLWLYQRSFGDTVPDLGSVPEPVVSEPAPAPVAEPVVPVLPEYAVPVEIAPVVEPEPVVVTLPEPTVVEPEPIVEPEPVVMPEPIPEPVAEPQPAVVAPQPLPAAPVAEPVVNKPAYNVSQQEKMFVSQADYDDEPEIYYDEDIAPYYSDQEYYYDDGGYYYDNYGYEEYDYQPAGPAYRTGYAADGGQEYRYE